MKAIHNPYSTVGSWYRGTVHAHTTVSDGACPPEEVIQDYAERGHDFLAISDHDAFVDPNDYRERTGLTLLPAVEVSANGPHVHHLGAEESIEPTADRQTVLDEIADRDGLAVLNHPNWESGFDHWSRKRLELLEGYAGLEIYNGVIDRLPGAALATDRWDQLLSAGRRVWGFANDDSHRGSDVDRAWNVVLAPESTPAAILEAFATGRFYASTGVSIRDVAVDGGTITVETADATRIQLVSDHGVVQQRADGPVATFRVPGGLVHGTNHTYVRLECVGRDDSRAWTQPLFLDS